MQFGLNISSVYCVSHVDNSRVGVTWKVVRKFK
jgi:hypothetical protein